MFCIVAITLFSTTETMAQMDLLVAGSVHRFNVINDGVMGGVSGSSLRLEDKAVLFSGFVSLENNGGFASFRGPASIPGGTKALQLSVRGDGKRYKLTLKHSEDNAAPQYQANFDTSGAWETLLFAPGQFRASFRGRPVDTEPLDFSRVRSLGVLISDRQDGPFKLLIRRITAQ